MFQFPANPTLGQEFTPTPGVTYVFDGTGWSQSTGDFVTVGQGDALWGIPTGVCLPYAGNSAPSGWLVCGGQAVSRTTYSVLFAIIGTTYGVGDGSSTFNLPDLRGRIPAGKDDMGGTPANRLTAGGAGITGTSLGAAGGDQLLQAHGHSLTDPGHTHSAGTTDAAGLHDHYLTQEEGLNSWVLTGFIGDEGEAGVYSGRKTSQDGSHTHNITGIGVGYTGASISSAGSGGAQNVQPSIVLNYIIKY